MHFPQSAVTPFKPGTQLTRYTLQECIGIGGMGWVFRAKDAALEQHEIALKIFYPHLVRTIDTHQFEAEVLTTRRLTHPHIVQVYNYHRLGSDLAVMSMELVRGTTLHRSLLEETGVGEIPVVDCITGVAAGLAFAHRSGVLHRDIKPENVLIDQDGTPKIADFGIAQLLAEKETVNSQKLIGTPAYMAPEQFTGGVLRPAADVYAFGILVYFLLHRNPPFESRALFELANLHCTAPLPLNPEIMKAYPSWISELLTICTAKAPEDRFTSMDDALCFIEKESGMTFPREETASSLAFAEQSKSAASLPHVDEQAKPVLRWLLGLHVFTIFLSGLLAIVTKEIGYGVACAVTALHAPGLLCRPLIRWANSFLMIVVAVAALAYYNPWTRERAAGYLLHFENLSGIRFPVIVEQLQAPISIADPISILEAPLENSLTTIVLSTSLDISSLRGPRGETLLHRVPLNIDHINFTILVKESGIPINGQDIRGRTPLFSAIDQGNISAARMLLGFGADPDIPDSRGISPLALAVASRPLDYLELLLCSRAAANAEMRSGSPERLIDRAVLLQDPHRTACLLRHKAQLRDAGEALPSTIEFAERMNPAGRNYHVINDLLKAARQAAAGGSDEPLFQALAKHNLMDQSCSCKK